MSDSVFPTYLLDEVRKKFALPSLRTGLSVRPLKLDDFERGYLQLLEQLTTVGNVTKDSFEKRFSDMKNCSPQSYFVLVVEDINKNKVIGSATLVLEWKFIHLAGIRARVEDVVVDEEMRGLHIGKLLNEHLVALARHLGAYKVSLECKDSLISFYKQFGYNKDSNNTFLVQKFPENDGKQTLEEN